MSLFISLGVGPSSASTLHVEPLTGTPSKRYGTSDDASHANRVEVFAEPSFFIPTAVIAVEVQLIGLEVQGDDRAALASDDVP